MPSIFHKRDRKSKDEATGSAPNLNQEHQIANPSTSQVNIAPIDFSQQGLFEFKAPGALDPTIDIIFVHGLNSDSGRAWKYQETGFWWPEQLGRDLPHARILLFNYDTFSRSPSKGTNLVRIPDIAKNLCHQLAGNRFEHGIKEGTRPIVMIGHSLGGLVIEKALVECNEDPLNGLGDILKSTICIMLFGTPNAGSLANEKKRVQIFKWISELAGYEIPPRIFETLKNHSLELLDLSKSFQKLRIWDTPQGGTPFMRTYYENRTRDKLGIQVVDETSAKVGVRGEVSLGVQTDHNQMVRFRDESDPTYKSVRISINMAMSKSKLETNIQVSQNNLQPDVYHQLLRGTSLAETMHQFNHERQPIDPTDEGDIPGTSKAQDDQIDYIDRPVPREERNFMGQQERLEQIDEKFSYMFQPGPKEPHSIGLLGLGGVGKTQLALKYFRDATRRQDNPFTTAFWVDSSSDGALETAISRIWELICPQQHRSTKTETTQPHKSLLHQVMSTLENWTRPYLIVFDNANSQAVLDYIPKIGPAAVIITTRLMRAADALNSPIWVRGLAIDIATSLLLRLLGCDSAETDQREEKVKQAEAIVQRLGGLPLAIHAAASYINIQHLTDHMSKFLPQYEEQKVYMLRQPSYSWAPSDENQNVFTTWELSLRALGTSEEDRARKSHFLSVCSFLSPHRISCVHFEQHYRRQSVDKCMWCSKHHGWMKIFSNFRGEFDRTRFREVVTEFEALSLVESCSVDASGLVSFSLHPLVRDWAMVRFGCCSGQVHFAEALVCLAATLDACIFIDGVVQPALLFYDPCQPVNKASSEICEGLLAIPDELSAHFNSCMASFGKYEWEPQDLTVLGLKQPEKKAWFASLFNSIFLYISRIPLRSPQIDRLATILNEEALSELFETAWFREDCELYILLQQGPNLPHGIENLMERACSRWQGDKSNTEVTFGRLFATYLHQMWLIQTGKLDIFQEDLPILITQAQAFMEKKLIDVSKDASSSNTWRWMGRWRRRTPYFADGSTFIDLGLFLVSCIMQTTIEECTQASNDLGLATPIHEWLKNYWLPESYRVYLRICRGGEGAMPLFFFSLAWLGSLQLDCNDSDGLLNTFKVFDALTASCHWFFTISHTTRTFLEQRIEFHRRRKEWKDTATYIEKLLQFFEKTLPRGRYLLTLKFLLAECYLKTEPINKARADEILLDIAAHDKPLSQGYFNTSRDIATTYYSAGLFKEAYECLGQLLQKLPTDDTLPDAFIYDVELKTADSLVCMLLTSSGLLDNHVLKKHLKSLTCIIASLFVKCKVFEPPVKLFSAVVKLYLSRQLWSNARWVLTEYLRIVGNRQCTGENCVYNTHLHPESRHFMIELHKVELMDLDSIMEPRMLLENVYQVFREFNSEPELELFCFNITASRTFRREYHSTEIYYDFLRGFSGFRYPLNLYQIDMRMDLGMVIKFMLKKWRNAYELVLEGIDDYAHCEPETDLSRLCLSLMPNLPHPATVSDQEINHVVMVLISWWLVPDLLGNKEWAENDLPGKLLITNDVLTSILEPVSSCSVCYPILASTFLYLHYKRKDNRKARYWFLQSVPGLRQLQSLRHEQIPDNHSSIYQLIDFELDFALSLEEDIYEIEDETTQDEDSVSLSGSTTAFHQDHRKGQSSVWEQAVYSLGSFLSKSNPARMELFGVVLLTSGVLGRCAFRAILLREYRYRDHYESPLYSRYMQKLLALWGWFQATPTRLW
ncbi:hypothetical protein F4805DRAFT_427611 [Annulohypoxylon moriforme]|nr:hypothetical protein F4805DRAFT_427611 [Annulohypoxylon moriforme]